MLTFVVAPHAHLRLNMTGVTRVHSELKLKGKGIKVGVIDTGIDFTHPALGGCFGANCRVAYGYDFVGDDYNGKNTPKPSEIPMDCAGHGSHVAGIIGASSDIIVGVAPEGAYRVLGCEGSTNDDLILAALERAVSEKMDVINLSIGESNGWPYNPLSRAVSKAKAMGVIITVSQGNDDKLGLFSANYVGEGPSVMAVASIINTRLLLPYFTTSLEPDYRYRMSNIPGLNSTLPLVAALNGTQFGLGCESFQVDLTGKVVVVMRGSCNFSVKAQHALDKGAVGILFANNVPDVFSASIGPLIFPYAGISQADGQRLFDSLKANTKTQDGRMSTEVMSFFNVTPIPFVNEAGGSTSQFSSYGLDNELHIKPDIGAPGENIYSTWPVRNGSYATLSGTSMASPHVAGALALALQHFRGITGRSTPPTWPQSGPVKPAAMSGSEAITSVAKQGSGMINIYRALTTFPPIRSTFVSPASLELNDTEFASGQHQMLTIHNYGSETVQYELSHLPAESLHELSIETKQYNVQFVDAEAKVVFSSSFLTVPAGGQRRVSLRILPPQGIPADQHWIYSGYIAVRAVSASMSTAQERVSTSELIHVPYAGVRGAMKTLPIFLR
ncbi:peptidase S8/S53 domain-containing protein, partial [Dissophora ornata]